jgi:hypothetical protein
MMNIGSLSARPEVSWGEYLVGWKGGVEANMVHLRGILVVDGTMGNRLQANTGHILTHLLP